MRVLFIIPNSMFGGPHNQSLRLHKPLMSAGIETFVMLPADPGNALERLTEAGVSVLTIPLRRFHRFEKARANVHWMLSFQSDVKSIQRAIRDYNINLVQIAGLVAPQGAIAARLERVPLVWQLVDDGGPAPFRPVARRVVAQLADSTMVTGETLAAAYLRECRKRVPTHVYFPPVDTSRFSPSTHLRNVVRNELGIPSEALVVGTVSNILPAKGLEYFVRAIRLVDEYICNCSFIIVGSPHPSCRKYYEQIRLEAARTGIPRERLIFTDSRNRVERLYAAMDVYMITSIREGVPSTAIEAMSCGLPLVATDVGGMREIVEDGCTGYLVRRRDSNALAAAVIRVLSSSSLRLEMGQQARRKAVECYDSEVCARIHLEAYRSATENARKRRHLPLN